MSARWIESLLLVLTLTLVAVDGAPQPGSFAVHDPEGAFAAEDSRDGEEASAPEVLERDTILSLVRAHRRSADEDWRRQLADAVYDESVRAGVDPLLVAAIVAKESSFQSAVVSRAGAVGLMQLRPFVARDVARRHGLDWEGERTLERPGLNVRLGILYYGKLVERYDGNAELALAAYHRGPSRLSRQLREGTFSTSRYAEGVLELYRELDARRDKRLALANETSSSRPVLPEQLNG